MMKFTSCLVVGLWVFLSGMAYATEPQQLDTPKPEQGTLPAGQKWIGEFYNITPTHMGVTEQYCKEHVLDTYQATPEVAPKEITAKNGVTAKDLGSSTKEEGSVYFHNGVAEFSGTYDEKPWAEQVHYFGLMLMAKGGMQQGAWYTKDCKGFYKVAPLSS